MIGGDVMESGEADPYGHRKLGGIGEVTGAILSKLTGEKIVLQSVAYLMRSGPPDALDLMVGVNYANMAMDLLGEGASGRMVALRGGVYTHIPMDEVTDGCEARGCGRTL